VNKNKEQNERESKIRRWIMGNNEIFLCNVEYGGKYYWKNGIKMK